jgi:hypothetical protein
MGMLKHRQSLAAVQRQGEFGRQFMEARVVLKGMQNLPGQRAHVEQLLRIKPSGRAEHQVAHIVAGRIARPKTGLEQAGNQAVVVGTYAANLQIAAMIR